MTASWSDARQPYRSTGGDLPHEAYLCALASLEGVGPARLRWLLGSGRPAEVWERVARCRLGRPGPAGVDDTLLCTWSDQARRTDPGSLWDRCVSAGIGVVSLGSGSYPRRLADDPDPPVVLFHLGDPDVLAARHVVAVVGTRRATGYGLRVAAELGRELAAAGVVVVSGLALGVDAAAHRGAVDAAAPAGGNPAPPVAVVGAGLDRPCPERNVALAGLVAERGVVLSEVPPGTRAAPWRFPVRNRIIAALSDAVVVVESPGAGGSMHTVREALERDRPVLAVPGPIHSGSSVGTNELLRDGAVPCLGAEDVLESVGVTAHGPPGATGGRPVTGPTTETRAEPTGDAAVVLESLGWTPASLEQLAAGSGLGFAGVSTAVAWLIDHRWVRHVGGWYERLAREADR